MLGAVTRQNVTTPDAPMETAASSSDTPCSCIKGISWRATNGKVTKIVASTIPGTEKITWMPASAKAPPSQPLTP